MLKLRPSYTDLQSQIVHSLEMDYEDVVNNSKEKFVFEDGSYIRTLAKQIVDDGSEYFEKIFMKDLPFQKSFDFSQTTLLKNLDPEINREIEEMKSIETNFDFILKNQGVESAIKDICFLLLKFPNHLPDEIVGWEIPDFEEEIPEDRKIFLVKKIE